MREAVSVSGLNTSGQTRRSSVRSTPVPYKHQHALEKGSLHSKQRDARRTLQTVNDTDPRRVDLLILRRPDRHFRILLLLAHCSVARARCIPTLGRLMRESSLFAPALVKQDAVSPAEGVGASDVERRVVDKVQIRDGRWRGRNMREGFVEECCV